jgi:hypothetical protein
LARSFFALLFLAGDQRSLEQTVDDLARDEVGVEQMIQLEAVPVVEVAQGRAR